VNSPGTAAGRADDGTVPPEATGPAEPYGGHTRGRAEFRSGHLNSLIGEKRKRLRDATAAEPVATRKHRPMPAITQKKRPGVKSQKYDERKF